MHICIKMVEEMERKTKAEKNLYEEIEVPEGISVNLENDVLTMNKDGKEVRRIIVSLINVKIDGSKIVISADRNRKIERKLFGTFRSHINNMIKGLQENFEYTLRVSNVHFPMNVSFDSGKGHFVIKNFLGEKKDRVISVAPEVDVKINGEEVIVSSHDIERAGQVATNIEKGAHVTNNRDRRIFQDGIFITKKPRRVYLE